ncbi:hypothetical protein BH11MYX4_BH11MYX4_55690 [soil metagenome]
MPRPLTARLARPEVVFGVLAALLLALAFGTRLGGDFVWDDVYYVRANAALHGPLRPMFTQAMWGTAAPTPAQFYRPLPMVSLWLQVRLTGMSLPAFRVGNLLLHAGCGALLMAWLRKQGVSPWIAAATSLAFLVHPSATECVMWVMGRHDLLATLLSLAALLLWPANDHPRRLGRALAASLCGGLAFLSKESFVIVPVLLALAQVHAQWRPGAKLFDRAQLLLGLPVVAVAAVFAVRAAAGVSTSSAAVAASAPALASTYATIVAHYTRQLASWSNGPTAESWLVLGAAGVAATLLALLLALLALGLAARRGSRAAAGALFGVSMFGVVLSPLVLALPYTGMFGNRYAYLPLVAMFVVIGHSMQWLAAHLEKAARRLVPVVGGALAVAIALSAVSTAAEVALWRDAVTLFGADVNRSPRDAKALYHYAVAIGREAGCATAAALYQRAVEADPTYLRAWHNLAGCLVNERRYDAAIVAGERALELSGGASRDEYNLGLALLGDGRRAEGIAHLERSVALEPRFAPARASLASALASP